MKFNNSHLQIFQDEINQIVQEFELSPQNISVESFTPEDNAIIVEESQGKHFRIHINLQEKRIIAVKQLEGKIEDNSAIMKYTHFMK